MSTNIENKTNRYKKAVIDKIKNILENLEKFKNVIPTEIENEYNAVVVSNQILLQATNDLISMNKTTKKEMLDALKESENFIKLIKKL